jgi:hypothetical protein
MHPTGPLSRKLQHFINAIVARAEQDDVLDPTELRQLAAGLGTLVPTAIVLEDEPVPERHRFSPWHVVQGGAA